MVGENRRTFWSVGAKVPFVLLALTMLVPYYWMAIGSLKPVPELMRTPPTFTVEKPTLNNFYDPQGNTPPNHVEGLFQRFTNVPWRFGTFYLNSVVVTVINTVVSLVFASAAAYVLAKLRLPGRNAIFLIVVASMMVPWQVTIIPNFLTMRDFGWINSYTALIVPALAKAFAVFFLRQYMSTLPDDLFDAARIDGAGEVRIWWSIVLPLVGPALTAMAIFVLLGEWNNFLWPLIVVQDDLHATLPLILARMSNTLLSPATTGVVMVASLLTSVPTVLFFLFFQKQFVEGIALTGVKG